MQKNFQRYSPAFEFSGSTTVHVGKSVAKLKLQTETGQGIFLTWTNYVDIFALS